MALGRRRAGARVVAGFVVLAAIAACGGARLRDEAPALELYTAAPDAAAPAASWTSFDTSGAEGCVKQNLHVDFGACRWAFDVLADAELVHCAGLPGTVGGNFKVDTSRGSCPVDEARAVFVSCCKTAGVGHAPPDVTPTPTPKEARWTRFDTTGAHGCVAQVFSVDYKMCRPAPVVMRDAQTTRCAAHAGKVGANFTLETRGCSVPGTARGTELFCCNDRGYTPPAPGASR